MGEIWKDIPGYEGKYQASNLGRVKSVGRRLRFVSKNGNESWRTSKERIISQQVLNSGYYLVHLHVDGRRTAVTVHSLIASAFLGKKPVGTEVNHKDGIKIHNNAINLEYVTSRENKEHAVSHGLNKQSLSVFALKSGLSIRYPSISSAAKKNGVTYGSIRYAINNKTICCGAYWSLA